MLWVIPRGVIVCQGVVIDDRRLGLREWMLSKPFVASALLLAKLGGHASGLLVALLDGRGAVLADGVLPSYRPLLATVAWTLVCLAAALWRFQRTELG
jgi:hypothetical protein